MQRKRGQLLSLLLNATRTILIHGMASKCQKRGLLCRFEGKTPGTTLSNVNKVDLGSP